MLDVACQVPHAKAGGPACFRQNRPHKRKRLALPGASRYAFFFFLGTALFLFFGFFKPVPPVVAHAGLCLPPAWKGFCTNDALATLGECPKLKH
jgi:hypothetical protein